MKKLFLIVLLMNVIFFAFIRLEGPGWTKPVKQELPPLHEDKIHLLDMSKSELVKTLPVPAPVQISAAPLPSSKLKLSMNMPVQAESKQEPPICLEWGDFSGLDLERATAALSGLQLGDKISQREVEQDTGYWVYMGPLKNKRAVNNKIGELKELGVNEYFVVPTGQWRNAISLGVFKTQEAAENLFNQLRTKGVRTAKIGERASKLRTTWFVLNGVNTKTKDRLVEIQKEFVGSKLANTPCTLTR